MGFNLKIPFIEGLTFGVFGAVAGFLVKIVQEKILESVAEVGITITPLIPDTNYFILLAGLIGFSLGFLIGLTGEIIYDAVVGSIKFVFKKRKKKK